MRPIRTVAVFPTMFTLGNLVCGFFAIVVASRIDAPESAVVQPASVIRAERVVPQLDREDPVHNMMLCGWLIFLAMVFDALDGQIHFRFWRTIGQFVRPRVVRRCAGNTDSENVSDLRLSSSRGDLDHRRLVYGVRGTPAGTL